MRVRLFTVDGDYVSTFAAHIDEVGTLLPPGGNGVVYAEDHYYLYSKFIRTLLAPTDPRVQGLYRKAVEAERRAAAPSLPPPTDLATLL